MLTPSLHKKLAAILYQTSISFFESIKTNAHLCSNEVQISTYCDIIKLESRFEYVLYTQKVYQIVFMYDFAILLVNQYQVFRNFSVA